MVEDRRIKEKTQVKPMGDEMVSLIEDIQKKFIKTNGFKPSMVDVTNMLARALRAKKIYLS